MTDVHAKHQIQRILELVVRVRDDRRRVADLEDREIVLGFVQRLKEIAPREDADERASVVDERPRMPPAEHGSSMPSGSR